MPKAKTAAKTKPAESYAPSKSAKEVKGNAMYILCYFFTWLSGLILYLTEGKEDEEMRFHSMQAIIFGIVTLVGFFFFFFPGLILWLYGMYVGYTAYSTGERMMIPVVGEYALKYSEKA